MSKITALVLGLVLVIGTAALCRAQYRGANRANPLRGRQPEWQNDRRFQKDVFTFVRIQYESGGRYGSYRRFQKWATDFPDSDLNFSFRLQQMTALKVNPEPKVVALTDPDLYDYPWIYIVEPGDLLFSDQEVGILRRYLLNGGFLMVDDFWGEREWLNFYQQIKRVFPDREPVELPIEHPVFHCVFDLKQKPQIPNVELGIASQYHGITWERPDARDVHIRGISDDQGRLMVIICHNTDLGDGWEREGENEYYFHEFSEKKAYPLGINIVFYAMTH